MEDNTLIVKDVGVLMERIDNIGKTVNEIKDNMTRFEEKVTCSLDEKVSHREIPNIVRDEVERIADKRMEKMSVATSIVNNILKIGGLVVGVVITIHLACPTLFSQ